MIFPQPKKFDVEKIFPLFAVSGCGKVKTVVALGMDVPPAAESPNTHGAAAVRQRKPLGLGRRVALL